MGHVMRMGEIRNVYKILVEEPEWKRPLGRSRRVYEYNITMDLKEIGFVGWIGLVLFRVESGGKLL